jgi:hypothetical protein
VRSGKPGERLGRSSHWTGDIFEEENMNKSVPTLLGIVIILLVVVLVVLLVLVVLVAL